MWFAYVLGLTSRTLSSRSGVSWKVARPVNVSATRTCQRNPHSRVATGASDQTRCQQMPSRDNSLRHERPTALTSAAARPQSGCGLDLVCQGRRGPLGTGSHDPLAGLPSGVRGARARPRSGPLRTPPWAGVRPLSARAVSRLGTACGPGGSAEIGAQGGGRVGVRAPVDAARAVVPEGRLGHVVGGEPLGREVDELSVVAAADLCVRRTDRLAV